MSGGIYLAAAGALNQQLRLEMLANNVANINTIGFKAEKSVFRVEAAPPQTTFEASGDLTQLLSPYAAPFTTIIDFSQGAIRQTGNPLDLALDGSGFFVVQTPDGLQYTRQGSFSLDEAGVLVTPDGHPVLGDGGVVTLERGTIEIDSQGAVIVDGEEVDRLQVVDFPNAGDLTKVGSGRFATVDGAVPEAPPENWLVHQGYLESANVNPVQAMTEMIETSRAFEAYQKVIQSADEATSSSINDVGTTI